MYCGYQQPFNLHSTFAFDASGGISAQNGNVKKYDTVTGLDIKTKISSDGEAWIKKDSSGRIRALSKQSSIYGVSAALTGPGLEGVKDPSPSKPIVTLTLRDSDAPSDISVILDYGRKTASCTKLTSMTKLTRDSSRVDVGGFTLHLKASTAEGALFDNLPTRNINGMSCLYNQVSNNLYTCFSKQFCAAIYSGGNISSDNTVNSITNGDSKNPISVNTKDMKGGSYDATINVAGTKDKYIGSGTTNTSAGFEVKNIDTKDFSDSVFTIGGVDISQCKDTNESLSTLTDYQAKKITSAEMQARMSVAEKKGKLDLSSIRIDAAVNTPSVK
jgi:hypothetical protein